VIVKGNGKRGGGGTSVYVTSNVTGSYIGVTVIRFTLHVSKFSGSKFWSALSSLLVALDYMVDQE
jgi:hypothetical protein